MMNKTIMFYDYGIFLPFAQELSNYFERVLYYCPWKSQMPKSNVFTIGRNIPGVEKVEHFWDHVKDVDLFIFPDVYDGDLQEELVRQGKRVWGSKKGEELELDRWGTHELLKELGLPVNNAVRLIGIDSLRKYLKGSSDKWVKISTVRGDTETFQSETYKIVEEKLDEVSHKLGKQRDSTEFIVEDHMEGAEVGYDGWTIDGKFPTWASFGYEVKDTGLIGVVKPYKDFPAQIKYVNETLSPVLSAYGYRGFWSTEIRLPDGIPYLIDPCCRCGSPPSELYQMFYSNWDEILWAGSEGEVAVPAVTAKYGVQVIIVSHWADKNWQSISFPPELARWVKFKDTTVIKNQTYVIPQESELVEIGSVVAIDNDLRTAIDKVSDYADKIKGFGLKVKLDALFEAVDKIEEGEKVGINFMHKGDEVLTKEDLVSV